MCDGECHLQQHQDFINGHITEDLSLKILSQRVYQTGFSLQSFCMFRRKIGMIQREYAKIEDMSIKK